MQDGFCNEANDNADCGYDGGDCCSRTCVENLEFPCGGYGGGFDRRDPDVSPACKVIGTSCEGNADFIQDLFCDNSVNNVKCGYDGGDCYIFTCVDVFGNTGNDGSDFLCGVN